MLFPKGLHSRRLDSSLPLDLSGQGVGLQHVSSYPEKMLCTVALKGGLLTFDSAGHER